MQGRTLSLCPGALPPVSHSFGLQPIHKINFGGIGITSITDATITFNADDLKYKCPVTAENFLQKSLIKDVGSRDAKGREIYKDASCLQ